MNGFLPCVPMMIRSAFSSSAVLQIDEIGYPEAALATTFTLGEK